MLIGVKKSAIFIAVALVFSLALVGCNSKEKQLQGKWKIDMTKLPAALTTGPAAAVAQKMFSGISIELKSDNTFSAGGAGQDQQGTWKLDGSTVTLTPTSGRGDKKPGTATLSDDGKTLTLSTGQAQMPSITFVKDSS